MYMNVNALNEYKTFQAFPKLGQANVYVFKAQTSQFYEVQIPTLFNYQMPGIVYEIFVLTICLLF